MDPGKEQILEAQIQSVMNLTGKSRLDALRIIHDQILFNDHLEELIAKEEQKTKNFAEGLKLQVNKLMAEHGYSRMEALLLIKEVLEDNKVIHKSENPEAKNYRK